MDIRAERKARGLTQAQLGEAIGVSTQSIKRWEWTNKYGTKPIPILRKALKDYFDSNPVPTDVMRITEGE